MHTICLFFIFNNFVLKWYKLSEQSCGKTFSFTRLFFFNREIRTGRKKKKIFLSLFGGAMSERYFRIKNAQRPRENAPRKRRARLSFE